MNGLVNYEVYINQNGTWDIVGRYPANRSEAALEEAKRLEFVHKKPTKVIRETFDEETQLFRENLVYISHLPPPSSGPSSSIRNADFRRGGIEKKQNQPKKKVEERQSFAESIGMLILAMLLSLIGSGLLSALLLYMLSRTHAVPAEHSQKIALTVFVLLFLVLAFLLAPQFVKWNDLLSDDSKSKKSKTGSSRPLTAAEREALRKQRLAGSSFFMRIIRDVFDFFDNLNGRKTMSERMLEEEIKQNEQQEEDAEQKAPETTEEIDYGDEQQQQQPEQAEQQKEETGSEEDPVDDDDDDSHLSDEMKSRNLLLTAYLSMILKHLKMQNIMMSNYLCFGLELMLAGAVDFLSNESGLSDKERFTLIRKQFELLGRNRDVAALFFKKLDNYVLEPQYLPMIEGGNKTFFMYREDSHSEKLSAHVLSLLRKWINPNEPEVFYPGIVTVMFTDIIGSTSMTETMGDKMAQEIVRAHNIIVRKALSENGGTEIKHTGDGIMASFVQTTDALTAAIAIRRNIVRYNREKPSFPLRLRIGLNVGEPIAENNDLYGLTVQKAARICAESNEDQILVSSTVKELSLGKNFTFADMGVHTLKGISEPQRIYSVEWESPEDKNPAEAKKTSLEQLFPEF